MKWSSVCIDGRQASEREREEETTTKVFSIWKTDPVVMTELKREKKSYTKKKTYRIIVQFLS